MAQIDNNRIEQLRNWKELPVLYLDPQTTAAYDQRIKTDCVDLSYPEYSMDPADGESDHTYVRYLMELCLKDYINYAKSMMDNLKYNTKNIKTILNEIIYGDVDEKCYKDKIEFYEQFCKENLQKGRYYYKLMEQAVKFNDKRMIYYLIFKRQDVLEDWLDWFVDYQPPSDEDNVEDGDLIPPTIESGFASDNCIVCCTEKPNILNIPCLHISTCESCEKIGELTKCSVCRMVIQRKVKI